jgi:hypothetical protein
LRGFVIRQHARIECAFSSAAESPALNPISADAQLRTSLNVDVCVMRRGIDVGDRADHAFAVDELSAVGRGCG